MIETAPLLGSQTPSITDQKPWMDVGFFDFGKAKTRGVDYFNCGIVQRNDGRWLVTRRATWWKKDKMGHNDIMAFKLNGLTPMYGIQVEMGQRFESEHFEDPRTIFHNGRTFVSACNFIRNRSGCTYPHQMIAEVTDQWKLVSRNDPVYGHNAGGMGVMNTLHEKNWLWFFQDDQLKMIYQSSPLRIVTFNRKLGIVKIEERSEHTGWDFGVMRGGSPPVLIGDEWWSFFHSSVAVSKERRQYHMGAYAFSKDDFRMTRMTQQPLLSGSFHDNFSNAKPMVVFPCGALHRSGEWLVVGGSNDLECFHAQFRHKDLLNETVEL